jgi:hypothetical protein
VSSLVARGIDTQVSYTGPFAVANRAFGQRADGVIKAVLRP